MILLLTGPPGGGKTTVAGLVADRLPMSVHLVADTFWHHVRSGYVLPWLPAAHRQNEVVLEAVAAAARQFANGGYAVVVDGVVGPWLLAPFLRQADTGQDVHYVVLRPDEQTALARAKARAAPALVDDVPLRHMYAEFSALGEYERYVVDTSQMSPDDTADHALRLLSGDTHRLSGSADA